MFKSTAAWILAFAIVPALAAQSGENRSEQDATFSAASQLVVLTVGVQDAHGANIKGLKEQDFKVYEDGHPQFVKQFSDQDHPVTLGIVFDASGSMRHKQTEAVTAVLAFVTASNPDDEMFVVNFNDHASLGLPPEVPFSKLPQQIESALLGRIPEGRTALYDAVVLAANHLTKGKWENKALLVISDGGDNNSKSSFNEAVQAVQMSGAALYSIALFDPDEPEHNVAALSRLSKMSGGEGFAPMELSEIRPLCLKISADIRASYTLAYTPSEPDQHATARKLKVVATGASGRRLAVRARSNYILPAP